MGGDFNLVLDVDKDKKGGLARTHKKSREVITNFFENLALIDAWRALNPESSSDKRSLKFTVGSIFS